MRDQQDFLSLLRLGSHFDDRHLMRDDRLIGQIDDFEHFHELVELLAGLLDVWVGAAHDQRHARDARLL